MADLDLLFRIRGDAAGGVKAAADTRAAIQQLRTSSTKDLKQIQNASATSLGSVSTTLGQVTQSIPLVGRAANSLSTSFDTLTDASAGASIGIASLAGPLAFAIAGMVATAAAVRTLGIELFGIARAAADFQGRMHDLSQQTGIAVETLSALEVLAKRTGGEIGGTLTQSLVAFQRNLESAQDPTSEQADLFRRLGVEANNTEDALRKTFAALAKLPEGFTQTNQAAELFGARGGKQVLAILKESQGDLDGAIEKFRELGILITEVDAAIADEFNDQLALLQFQLRATGALIGREVIPVVLSAIQELSRAFRENRELIDAIATAAGILARLFTNPLRGAIFVVTAAWEHSKPAILAIQAAYEAIAAAAAFIAGHPILPTTIRQPTEPQETSSRATDEAAPSESRARQRLQAQLQAQRELLAAQTAFFDQEKSLAADRLAQAEREFQLGQATRKDKLQAEIESNRAIRDADLEQLAHKRALLLTEAALASDDLKKRTDLESQITELDQKAEERRAQSDREQKDLRAKARQQEREDLIAHQESLLELGAKFDAARIASIEAAVRAGTKAALEGDQEIAAIENTILDREQAFLVKKLAAAGIEPAERRKIALEIDKIDADRTLLAQQQEDRRLAIVKRGTEAQKQTLTDSIDTLLQVEQIRAASLIASIQALAAARVKSEEDAAREITAIRVGLIDSEIEAIQAKLSATRSIADPVDRTRAQAELNNRIKVLEEERTAIQNQGERDREEGRQRDLDNERRYADELIRTKERIRDIERDAARAEIDLMIIHHARRRDILRARRAFDQADEEDRHRQALERIRLQEEENRESNRTQEEKDQQEAELNRLREIEAERHRLAMQGIRDQGKQDEEQAGAAGGFLAGLKRGELVEFEDGIKSFADASIVAFSAVGVAVNGLTRGIGNLVEQYVLLGTTGPNALRKLLASVLASLAAEAAVKAIFQLAEGFAMLFINPAQAAAHFKAAALYGSIAGVAAIAGRHVAGDLFKQKDQDSNDRNQPGQLNPLTLQRNAGPGAPPQFAPQITPVRVEITVSDSKFGNAITAHVVDDVNNAGPLREIIAGDGNLNRG